MTLLTRIRTVTRRDVLAAAANFSWAAPLALAVIELARFLRFEPPSVGASQFSLGAPASLPRLPAYLETGQVWLHQDAGGYYAVDAICTHLGCTIRLEPDGLQYQCRCHGSRFELDGAVLNGPATRPLRFLRLYWGSGGKLTVDRATETDPSFRLPPV